MEEESKIFGKLIIVRQAQSRYNQMAYKRRELLNLPKNVEELCYTRWVRDIDMIDADLTEKGIEQSKAAISKINELPNLKYAFASPMVRATRTGKIMLSEYSRKLEWRWIPELRETLSSNCDLALKTKEIFEEYGDIEYDAILEDPIWYLRIIPDDPEERNFHKKAIELYEQDPHPFTITEYMSNIYPFWLENGLQVRESNSWERKIEEIFERKKRKR